MFTLVGLARCGGSDVVKTAGSNAGSDGSGSDGSTSRSPGDAGSPPSDDAGIDSAADAGRDDAASIEDAGPAADAGNALDGGEGGSPSKIVGGYYPNWTPSPVRIRDVDPHYNLIYLFAATPVGGSPGTGAIEWSPPGDGLGAATNLDADIAYARQ